MIFVQQVNEYKKIRFKVKTYESIKLRFNFSVLENYQLFLFLKENQ